MHPCDLRIIHRSGKEALAWAYVAELPDGSRVEMVESVQPPIPRERKWVLIISTLRGCPIACPICDAGARYDGRLTEQEILGQIDFLVRSRFPSRRVPVPKFKIQLARMGDPAFNPAAIAVLRALPNLYDAPGLMPCISTVAPAGRERFFDDLLAVKRELYRGGQFQLQFTLHTTDERRRRELVPARTWSFREMAAYGDRFFTEGDRRIALNFATPSGYPLEPSGLALHFSPERFMVKLTPINPTGASRRSGLAGMVDPCDPPGADRIADRFRRAGYETLVSVGEVEENAIGSNCGQLVDAMADFRKAAPERQIPLRT